MLSGPIVHTVYIICRFRSLKHFLTQPFTVDIQKGPLLPKICIGPVLLTIILATTPFGSIMFFITPNDVIEIKVLEMTK